MPVIFTDESSCTQLLLVLDGGAAALRKVVSVLQGWEVA
jgi:hypothetical protein